MNKKNNRKGFTIVELVIVIAVIGILATVLIPTFGNVISNANKAALKQEAKNIYTNYVMACTNATEDYENNCWIKITDGSDDYYVEIANGAVSDADPETSTPDEGDYVLDKDLAKTCYDVTSNDAEPECGWCGTKH